MPYDFKKEQKELYLPKTTPSVVDVPELTFIAVDGKGDPNTCTEYSVAIELLYGLSWTIKMGGKPVLENIVPPLEGYWDVDDGLFKGGGAAVTDKGKFVWTMMIRQPGRMPEQQAKLATRADFVTAEVFESAKIKLAKKKPSLDISKARLEKITEGLCVQAMHIGPYDGEPATIAAMERYAVENSYAIDINDARRHHEIYISDPRKTAPEKLRTVIRHPIRKI
jgi:hypothetical protein